MNGIPPEAVGLMAALAIGLLIGLERGWHDRDLPEGRRVAGLRTFALTGLLGGVLASLPGETGVWLVLAGLLAIALLLAISYWQAATATGNLSITTAVAMLVTLTLGAYAASGEVLLSLAAAVIVALLLNLKPTLHGWLRFIEHRELSAALQLLVLSVVILPNLPNKGFGPYSALNPYELWWAVILISGLSLAGHIAMRLSGPHRGILWTGLLGGLASSTAATLALSRYARQQPALAEVAADGALAACGIMFFRMSVLLGVIQPALLAKFGLPLIVTGLVMLAVVYWHWRKRERVKQTGSEIGGMEPFDLSTAFGFSAFLAIMAVLVPAAKEWLGTFGVYALAAISGLADVDAITISLARTHGAGGLPVVATMIGISLAALVNMLSKASIAYVVGGAKVGWNVAKGYLLSLIGGSLSFLIITFAI